MKKIAEYARQLAHGQQVELSGTAVSRGLAIGCAVRLYGAKRQFPRIEIPRAEIGSELERLVSALEVAMEELGRLAGDKSLLPAGSRSIFDAHQVILEHSSFLPDIKDAVNTERVNAEWAIMRVTDSLANKLSKASDVHVREKAVDVQDVGERLLNALSPHERPLAAFWADAVIVASSVRPSTIVELLRYPPKAIVTEHGGWTSHAFIMARELCIPAVTSLRDLCRNVLEGDMIIVDGFSGRVVVRPEQDTISAADANRPAHTDSADASGDLTGTPATVDGRNIVIRANVEHFSSSEELRVRGADGVGLIRSEYLFDLKRGSFPAEDSQYRKYRSIADKIGNSTVRIRTFDLNADQLALNSIERDKNPSLGLRAVRLMLSNESSFRAQVRAILRANSDGNISVLLPMVSGPEDIIRSRSIIDAECKALSIAEDDRPEVGVMIEVPSAVIMIDEVLKLVDCVCIGTNDLVQYLLAVDRDNESVASWYQTLHPAVLRSIRSVLTAAEIADIPAVICGEMAGSPFYTPLLIGMGAREFSMNLNAVPAVRRVIHGISYEEARDLAAEALASNHALRTEQLLRAFYQDKWPHLFEPSEAALSAGSLAGEIEK